MKAHGMHPIPVVHYSQGSSEMLKRYVLNGEKQIALGGTVPIRDKVKVADWCEELKRAHPTASMHLLGSCSEKILQSGAVASCDSSTWYIQAVNGRPKTIPGKSREAKMARAEANMRRIMEAFDEDSVPLTDRGSEPADR